MKRLTAFLLVVLAAAATAHAATSPWKREGRVVADVGKHNLDIVSLGGTKLRAYFMQGGSIGSLRSANGGRSWTVEPGVRVRGSHPAAVALAGGAVRLYFTTGREVRSAISEDGLAFEEEPGIRLAAGGKNDPASIAHPHVVALPGGGYRMYYDGERAPRPNGPSFGHAILSAVSKNGLAWRKEPGIRVRPHMPGLEFAGMTWSPFAERAGGVWKLYFSVESASPTPARAFAEHGLYVATSRDGLSFRLRPGAELGTDPRAKGKQPTRSGQPGVPQDAFAVRVPGGKRLFFWQAGEGVFSAFRPG